MLRNLLFGFLLSCVSTKLTINNFRAQMKSKQVFEKCFEDIVHKEISNTFNVIINSRKTFIDFPVPYLGKTDIDFQNIDLLEKFEKAPSSFIITVEDVEEFNDTLSKISSANYFWKTHLMHYILILKYEIDLPQVVRILWFHNFYKSIILFDLQSKVEMYSIHFERCGKKILPMKINECYGRSFKKTTPVFEPDMRRKLHKCPFKVIWVKVPPWVNDVNGTEPGIFIEIIEVFKDVSQLDVIFMPENKVYAKELSEGYSFDSMIDDFDNKKADLFVGLSIFVDYLRVSSIYSIDNHLYIIIPRPKTIPYWQNVVMLFSLQSWISMTLTFFLAAVVFHIVVKKSLDENRFGSSREIVFYALTVSLNMGLHKVPKTTRLRTLIGSWMFYILILAAIVQGKLFSFISKPPLEKPITNLEELAASDVPIKALEVTKLLFMFKDKTNDVILEKIEILEKVESLNIIADYAHIQNFATIVDEGVLILEPKFKKLMQYFTISNILMVFYMPFDHVLNEYFEKTLHRIVESGFFSQSISKWKHIYSLRSKIEEKEKTVFSIGVHQMESAFFVLAFGITSAFLTFILEHITHIFTSRLASKCDKTKTYTSLIYIE